MAPAPPPLIPSSSSALSRALAASSETWQSELKNLFDQAKTRYPDVVWDMLSEEDEHLEEIWGHKAIVYARAPPSFQARYFTPRTTSSGSPTPYSTQHLLPAQSTLSLSLPPIDARPGSRSPSPFGAPQRTQSPAPSMGNGVLLRLPLAMNPALFSNELEYLYTGKGMGEAFEFLFDTSAENGQAKRTESVTETERREKLRKDLVYMWRSRLYSDVRITLTGSFSSSNSEVASAVFSSHRFILISRVPYFRTLLSSAFAPVGQNISSANPLPLSLPSPPFTPASLHFTLGFIYTGTMAFSHRNWDLDTAFHIIRSAKYLQLDTLDTEARARIIEEMMHGLFHAYLPFDEYERVIEGKWGTGGCKCKQCQRRAPRVLEFALGDDIRDNVLERGAQRALVGMYGEGWATSEFLSLPLRLKNNLLKGVNNRTTPQSVIPLLQATAAALSKLSTNSTPAADAVKELVLSARKKIDEVLCGSLEDFFEQPEWVALLENDGARFGDMDTFELVLESIRRGLTETNAGPVYQAVVSSVLLRSNPATGQTILSTGSPMRVQIERLRSDVIVWMRKHWPALRVSGCFENLEGWALKEISDELDVQVEDMSTPTPGRSGPVTRTGLRTSAAPPKIDGDAESISIYSLRTGALNRTNTNATNNKREPVASSSRSVHSIASRHSTFASAGPPTRPVPPVANPTRLRPVTASTRSSYASNADGQGPSPGGATQPRNSTVGAPRRSLAPTTSPHPPAGRPKSLAPSVTSVRSAASTVRHSHRSKESPTAETVHPTTNDRPVSTVSNASFKTAGAASTGLAPGSASTRGRKISTASTASNLSVHVGGGRRPSNASGPPPTPRTAAARTASGSSQPAGGALSRSGTGASAKSVSARRPSGPPTSRPPVSPPKRPPVPKNRTPPKAAAEPAKPSTTPTPKPNAKGKGKAHDDESAHSEPRSSRSGASTLRGRPAPFTIPGEPNHHTRKSTDTVTASTVSTIRPSVLPGPRSNQAGVAPNLQGVTLNIGIPCLIISKQAKYKAFARYIGEIRGELGPWVGVEVPVADTWGSEKLGGRQWNDGSVGGIRYFEVGSSSPWDDSQERTARRRRIESVLSGKKREGDTMSIDRDRMKRLRSVSPAMSDVSTTESRGLFVRPSDVIYVFDAVDDA
ncbi:hypothetical protein FS749_010413 [Ceratobasidium sp. UAMH 11750]|nr:hypothetical protein FS749_010413 [Ceratobasidium sp. UAMH 11750]